MTKAVPVLKIKDGNGNVLVQQKGRVTGNFVRLLMRNYISSDQSTIILKDVECVEHEFAAAIGAQNTSRIINYVYAFVDMYDVLVPYMSEGCVENQEVPEPVESIYLDTYDTVFGLDHWKVVFRQEARAAQTATVKSIVVGIEIAPITCEANGNGNTVCSTDDGEILYFYIDWFELDMPVLLQENRTYVIEYEIAMY